MQHTKMFLIALITSTLITADLPEDKTIDPTHQHYEIVKKCLKNDSNRCINVLKIYCQKDLSSYNNVSNALRNSSIILNMPRSTEMASEEEVDQLQRQQPSYTIQKREKNKKRQDYIDQNIMYVEIPLNSDTATCKRQLRSIGRLFANMEDIVYLHNLLKSITFSQSYYGTTDFDKQERILEQFYYDILQDHHNPVEQAHRTHSKSKFNSLEEFKHIMRIELDNNQEEIPPANMLFYAKKYIILSIARTMQCIRYIEDTVTDFNEWIEER